MALGNRLIEYSIILIPNIQIVKFTIRFSTSQNPITWTDSLPLILLGIRTTLKEDLHCTAAELVYSITLRLPGEYFEPSISDTNTDISNYVTKLKLVMQHLKATPLRPRANRKTYVNNDSLTCTHVFVRHDAIRKPLQQPYDGLFTVIKHTDKHFTIQRNNHDEVVSIDRLKPTYIDTSVKTDTTSPTSNSSTNTSSPSALPTHKSTLPLQTTRSGCHVRWPKHLLTLTLRGSTVVLIGYLFMYIKCFVTINTYAYLCTS